MCDLVNDELDAIHKSEIALAKHIRTIIINDIEAGKFNKYELAGRLSKSHVGVEAMKTRQTWTLRYAITIARRLGYSLGTLEVIKDE